MKLLPFVLIVFAATAVSAGASASGIYHDGWIDFNKNGVKDVYEDPGESVERRVADLLARMTVEEKSCQVVTLYGTGRVLSESRPVEKWKSEIWNDGIANLDEELNGVGWCYKTDYELVYPFSSHVKALDAIQRWFVEETRLGIPVDFTNEGIHGLNHTKATPLPAPIAVGSAWNRELTRRAGEIIGREAKLLGYSNVYAPILDLARDPRWGRTPECYGESPYLVAELGNAMVRGIQSAGVAATVKHYAAYSVPKGARDGDCRTDPHITPRELHEIFLYPFRRVIRESHPLGVMASYNDWDGVPVVASHWFMTELLRDEWGFDGYTVSDSGAVAYVHNKHAVAETYEEAVRQVLEAGLDVRTDFSPPEDFALKVRSLVADGRLPMATLDRRVGEVLSVKFRLGLFDRPYADDPAAADRLVGIERNLAFVDEVQAQSMVLLKNDGLLPLDAAKLGKVLVTGPLADETNFMISRYGPNDLECVSVLEGLRDCLKGRVEVVYRKGCEVVDRGFPDSELVPLELDAAERAALDEAERAAAEADLVIAVLGEDELRVGESRSRTSLDLPGRQQLLLERMLATGKRVVVVLVNGRPLTVNLAARRAGAILETWLPSCRGGVVVAKMLFGELSPSGRLPVTIPKSIGEIELNFPYKKGSHGGQPKSGPNGSGSTRVTGALYPFGHGLGYTRFEYGALRIEELCGSSTGAHFRVSCEVRNVGARPGTEVVQLYVRDRFASVVTYDSVLRGFERVELKPGEARRVVFELKGEELQILDRDMKWRVEPGDFDIMIGASSEDIRLRGELTVR